jgi:hypothetical protein
MDFIVSKLKEKSTYAGLLALLSAAGLVIDPEQFGAIATVIVALGRCLRSLPQGAALIRAIALAFAALCLTGCATFDGIHSASISPMPRQP